MPTTSARRWCIPSAIRWFRNQDYPEADLLVVGDGEHTVRDLVPEGQCRYVHLDGERTLGAKYNACVERARGPLVALWADDDWHAPWKLSWLVHALQARPEALLVGTRAMLFHRLSSGRTWVYERPDNAPYFLGGCLLFRKSYWGEIRKFDESAKRSADAHFTNSLSRDEYAELAVVLPRRQALGCYVATIHGSNTGRADVDPAGRGWSPWTGNLAALMGPDYSTWHPEGLALDARGE